MNPDPGVAADPIAFLGVCLFVSVGVLFLIALIVAAADHGEECDCPRITLKAQRNDGHTVVRIRHRTDCQNREARQGASTKEVHA